MHQSLIWLKFDIRKLESQTQAFFSTHPFSGNWVVCQSMAYWRLYKFYVLVLRVFWKARPEDLTRFLAVSLDWQMDNFSIHSILATAPILDLLIRLTLFLPEVINPKLFVPIGSVRQFDPVIDEDFLVRTNISNRDDRTN